MRDKITVYGLLSKIYNGNTDMPKKICFCGYDYEWDNDFKDYLRNDDEKGYRISFLENHDDNLMAFLQDTVDIIQDNKIEKIKNYTANVGRVDDSNIEKYIHILFEQQSEIIHKFDEIIEVLNERD